MPSVAELSEICIPLVDEAAYKKRKLKVVTIGAGFSGLIFAHKIQHDQPDLQNFIDHTIFEANDEIGGTWKNNTYPGVQCDVPSHIYVSRYHQMARSMLTKTGFSFRPKPELVEVLF